MKSFVPLCLLASGLLAVGVLTGCLPDRLSSDGNAGKFYQPYSGLQTNWPTAPACFITKQDNMIIYHGYPPMQYTIMGRFDRPNIPLFRIVKCAHHFNADAIMLSEEPVIEQKIQPGVVFGNGNVVASTSWTSRSHKVLDATAYLIKTNVPSAEH